ncbi:hypothetical protein [Clostridium culturomicium]|uniref:hypothetical protein n=1 Tax=Clostridium culturomicium TaxID=1499683 RepID=UPI003857EF88
MKKVLKIDIRGFFIEDVILNDGDVTPENCIEVDCPEGFYKPKWDGEKWSEGLTQQEIEELKKQPIPKSDIETLQEEVLQQSELMVDMEFRLTSLELGL